MFPEDETGTAVNVGSETAVATVVALPEQAAPVEPVMPKVSSDAAEESETPAGHAADEHPIATDTQFGLEPAESAGISEMMTGMGDVPGLAPGQVKKGFVVKVTDTEVMVDIG